MSESAAKAPRSGIDHGQSAEYQRFYFGTLARSGPLQQIWIICAVARPSEEERHLPDGDHANTPAVGRGPRERTPTREHVA